MVVVAYERWAFTRDSTYRDVTRKNLVFWKGGRLREVVAHGGLTLITRIGNIENARNKFSGKNMC